MSLSVPVLMVLERTDLANEVMFDLALGATELNEGRVLAVMFEPDGHSGDRSARVSSRIGGLPTSQQHRVHTERADPVNSASLAATARKVCGAANSALVEAVVGQVNTMGGLGRLVRSPAIGAQLESGTSLPPTSVHGSTAKRSRPRLGWISDAASPWLAYRGRQCRLWCSPMF
ncbi:MAG: hypothetical protein IPH38_08355 [Candidatus Microthrix sp.]|nr:hypothetical protein [Candidatus Microthrix sp.]MBK7019597.1 hypothetical protein [Candidatus Microthrix sp.]